MPNRRPRGLRRPRTSLQIGVRQRRRRDRRGARPPCPAAATGGAWRRPAGRADGALMQAGRATSRARRVEEAAVLRPVVGNTLRPRRTSNFGGLDSLMEFSVRARTGQSPTSSPARGDAVARLRPVENAAPFPVSARCLRKCPQGCVVLYCEMPLPLLCGSVLCGSQVLYRGN
uniref:H0402C08.3 protein n=1 Tax=Oryza sativa TaxID=4530 RepID=Q259J5_ORYSA|nr:H0402C08.3 [Oryza sativa]